MKQVKIAMILVIATFMLFMAACGNEDDNNSNLPTDYTDISPATADWVIMFGSADGMVKTPQMVMIFWTGDIASLSLTDTAEFKFNGNPLTLETLFGAPGFYFAALEAAEGQTYSVEFKYNNVTKVNTDMKMVYSCNATFPTTFSSTQSATWNWTLANNNQYQMAGGSSYRPNEPNDDDMDYFGVIDSSARSYTLGANKLTNFGYGTEYTLEVDQLNYKVVSHVALMSFQGNYADYGYATQKDQAVSMRTRAMKIYTHMQNR